MNRKTKIFSGLLSILMVFMACSGILCNTFPLSADSDSIEIGDAEELVAWAAAVADGDETGKAILTANIDMTGETWPEISVFNGVLDGNGYAISHLTVTRTTADAVYHSAQNYLGGLFHSTTEGMTVCNLALIDYTVKVTHGNNVGGKQFYVGMLLGGSKIKENASGSSTKNCVFENVLLYDAVLDTASIPSDIKVCNGTLAGATTGANMQVKNCSFYGKVSDLSYPWGRGEETNITQSYGILTAGSCVQSAMTIAPVTEKVYLCGAGIRQDTVLGQSTTDGTAIYANDPAEGWEAAFATKEIFVSDLIGSKMGFGEDWVTFADGTPVQKVFIQRQSSVAAQWSVGHAADMTGERTEDHLRFLGASIRIAESTTRDATAIRFSVEVNQRVSFSAYGILLVPTKALTQGDTIFTSPYTLELSIEDLTGHTEHKDYWSGRYGEYTDQFNIAVTDLPAGFRDTSFTVCAFVKTDAGACYYTEATEVIPSHIAYKAYQANDNREKMLELFEDTQGMQELMSAGARQSGKETV